jgi:hypothetical protein
VDRHNFVHHDSDTMEFDSVFGRAPIQFVVDRVSTDVPADP